GPVMLRGGFSFRIVTTRTRGRAHGRRDDSIDCDSDIRGRLRAIPMGYEARPLQDQQVEERIGQALQLKPVISENSIWLRMIGADACSPALARNVRRRAARDWIFLRKRAPPAKCLHIAKIRPYFLFNPDAATYGRGQSCTTL